MKLTLILFLAFKVTVDLLMQTTATDNLPLGCEYRFREENEVLCRGTFPDFDFRSQSTNSTDDDLMVSDLQVSDCEFAGIQKHYLSGVNNLLIFQVGCNYTGSGELAIERGTFANFAELYIIRIQHGGFSSVPLGIFCEVRELYELNLEHNNIADLADIGLLPSCDMPSLKEITLSHNSIKVIRNDSLLCHLTHIAILDISDNGLEVIEQEAFVHLSKLSVLNLQNNRLKRLSPSTFNGLSSVWALALSNNLLDNDNWADHVLHPLTDLMVLYLDENRLSNIDTMFRNLSQLQELHLGANQISHVASTTFAGTDDLAKLVLNNNRVTSVDDDALSSNLLELQLNGNRLTSVRFLRNKCEKLMSLHLSDNQIVTLDNELSRCEKLTKLHLDRNQIRFLDDRMFANLTKLQILNLSGNRISSLGDDSFKAVGSLMELRLDGNHLGSLPEIFTIYPLVQLNSLVSLNLSNNQIGAYEISFHEFQSVFHNLRDLDLSHNKIFYVKVSQYLKLRRLNLSFNELPQISYETDWPAESVEELLLNDNQILFINPQFFSRTRRLNKLYLHNNNLTALHELEFNKNRGHHEVTLRGNPWHCDCNLKWLADTMRSGQKFKGEGFLSISDNDQVTCDREFQRSGKPTLEVKIVDVADDEEAFLCRFKCTHSVSEKPKCKAPCPAACSCYKNLYSTRISVDCSSRDLNGIPAATSNLTTNLYLDSNNLSKVGPKDFLGLQFVETLDISWNSLEDIERGTLDGMPKLTNLQLNHNRLQRLPNDLFKETKNMTTLNLAHNWLEKLTESLFAPLRHLRTLNLNHNRLTTFPVWTLSDRLLMLTSLTLEQNPWSCECDYAMRFAEWLTNTDIRHLPTRDIQCTDANDVLQLQPRTISLLAFNASHCYTSSGASRTYLPALIGIISLFLLIILLAVPTFRYRWEVQVLLYHHYGVRLFHRNDDDSDDVGKNYDAFVAYTSQDEDFLIRELLPKLEGKERQRQYKLCLHHRNFMPGAFIIDNILEAIEQSRRTIVLLTPNFVRSEWCRFEFKSAHMQMLKDRRRRLIVIVVGEIPLGDVDHEMKIYLTTNTYLSWDEKYFWQKLYFALPE